MNTRDTARFWLDTLLHSYSQVLFQCHRFCGLLILLAIALDGATALLGSLLGWSGALLGARLIRADAALVRAGYYGFNGVLVGLALGHFLGGSWFSASAILLFSALSAPLIHLQIRRWSIAPYTSAFVLLGWCAWLLVTGAGLLPAAQATLPATDGTGLPDWLAGPIQGLGQVFFLGSLPAGLLILAALAVSAPRNAAWGLSGALLGSLVAALVSVLTDTALVSMTAIDSGLFGYNGALAALALAQRFTRQPGLIAIGVVMATLLQPGFSLLGLPALTAPFILACWLVCTLAGALQPRPGVAP